MITGIDRELHILGFMNNKDMNEIENLGTRLQNGWYVRLDRRKCQGIITLLVDKSVDEPTLLAPQLSTSYNHALAQGTIDILLPTHSYGTLLMEGELHKKLLAPGQGYDGMLHLYDTTKFQDDQNKQFMGIKQLMDDLECYKELRGSMPHHLSKESVHQRIASIVDAMSMDLQQ